MKKTTYILLIINLLTVFAFAQTTWTGNTSTDWNNTRNWNPRTVPTSATDVIIPTGRTRYPIVSSNKDVKNLTLQSGASITVNSGITLGIYGNLSDAGYINAEQGSIAFRGTSNSTIARVSSGYVNVFYEGFEGDVSKWTMGSISGNTEWRKQVTTGTGKTGTYDASVYNLKDNKGHDYCHNCGYNYVDISTEIDLSSYSNANLNFKWMNAVNNGSAWAMVLIDGVTLSAKYDLQGSSIWTSSPTYNIDQFCGAKHKLTFRFWIVPVTSTPGFSVDEINITAIPNIETFNNLLIEKTNNAQVTLNSPTYINNNITINQNAVFNTNGNNVIMYKNIINNGTINAGTSTVTFLGNKKSKIKGSSNTTLYNLVIKKDDYTTFIIGDSLTNGKTIEVTNSFDWDCMKDSLIIGDGRKTNFKIKGNLVIGNFSTLVTKDTSSVTLNGNYINYGVYLANNGKFIFEGSTIDASIQRKPAYIVMSDSFEVNPINKGWTLGASSASAWTWSSGRQHTGNYDMAIWDTRNGGAPYDYAWDVADGGALVLSKQIDLTNLTGASMTFWWRCGGSLNPSTDGDYGIVMIDNDTIMTKMWNQLDYIKSPKFELSKYCGKTSTLKFIFKSDTYFGAGQATSPGLCIDDLEIYSNSEAVETFYDLVIDKPNKNITVTCPIVIENNLNLKNGNLYTSPDTLIIAENANWTRENGMVYGNLSKQLGLGTQNFTYPLGTACGYSPVEVTFYNITTKGAFNFNVLGLTPTYSEPTDENLKKYWRAINKGLVYDSVMMKLKYSSCDFNTHLIEKDDEYSMDWMYLQGADNHRLANLISRDTTGDGGYVTLTNTYKIASHIFYARKHYIDPIIVKHPESYIICTNTSVALNVSVTGTSPFTYQWYKNDALISGAIDSIYTIPSVQLSDSGQFHCVIKNRRNTTLTSNKGILSSYNIYIVQNDSTIIKGDSTYLSINALFNKYSLLSGPQQSLTSSLIKVPINYTGNVFSVEWWINPYSLITPNVIGNVWGRFVAHNNALGAMYVGTDINTRFGRDVLPAGTIEVDKWQHFAFTFNNGIGKFYKNGNLLLSKTNMTNPNGAFDTLYLNQMSAYIDEIKVWKSERTQSEIQYYMHKKPEANDANLITFINFDNGDLKDYTGKNNASSNYSLTYNKDVPSDIPCIWNTGASTQRIKVKPLDNTTYIVTYTGCLTAKADSNIVHVENIISLSDNKILKLGENTTLSATGATYYSWSNGQTTPSITVSPTVNTKYYVTGYKSSVLFSIDSVEVFIFSEIKDTSIFKGDVIGLNASINKKSLSLSDATPYSRVYIPNNPALQKSGDITIEMWIYNYGTNDNRNIFYKNRTAEGVIWIGSATSSNNVLVYQYGQGVSYRSFTSNSSIEPNKWTHIALVRNLSAGKLYWYINGNLDKEETTDYSYVATSTNPIYIGYSGTKFNGLLDEFRMWNKALTKEEIKDVINNKLSITQNQNTILNLEFDNNNLDSIYDSSPNKINGLLQYDGILSKNNSSLLRYSWSNGDTTSSIEVSPSVISTYTVTVYNNNTNRTEDVVVNVYENAFTLSENKIVKAGENVELIASGANSYSWSNGATTSSISITPTSYAKYYVTALFNNLPIIDSVELFVFSEINDTTISAGANVSINASINKKSLNLSDNMPYSRAYIPNNTALQNSGNITIEMWIYNYGANDNRNIFYKNRTAEGVIWIGKAGGKNNVLVYQYGQGVYYRSLVSNSSIEANKWTHIALVRNLSAGKLYWYINGILDKEENTDYTYVATSNDPIYIGFSGTKFNGLLDEFRMWNKPLTATEINEVMNSKVSSTQNQNIILNLEFDKNNLDTIYDSSPNKINGLLQYNATLSKNHKSLLNYSWSNGDTVSSIDVNPTITTTYTITLTKGEINRVERIVVYVINTKSDDDNDDNDDDDNKNDNKNNIAKNNKNFDVFVYPNPSNGKINIEGSINNKDNVLIKVYNMIGKEVIRDEFKSDSENLYYKLDLSMFEKGIYLINITNDNLNESYKIIVK